MRAKSGETATTERVGAVDARELGLGTEEAERVLPLLEDRGDGRRLGAGDDDLAAHRLEAVDVHDVEVATGGGWTAGAICAALARCSA